MSHTSYSLQHIADTLNLKLQGDGDCLVQTIAPLHLAQAGDISFLTDSHYRKQLADTQASAVLLSEKDAALCPTNALVATNASLAVVDLIALLYPKPSLESGVHASAVVSEQALVDPSASIGAQAVVEAGARIAADVVIGAGCYVGQNVTIELGSQLKPRVTIMDGCQVGKHCVIHSGVVIGSDGFGNVLNEKHHWVTVPQLGVVRIGDGVEIGANTTIDRGALGDTVIGHGVRLDNQIQVAHNVQIGDHTAVAGCVGIAGSAVIGRHCMIGGGSCIGGHITICDGAMFTGMSMVTQSVKEPGVYSSGTTLLPNKAWHKSVVRFKQLDALAKRVTRLEKVCDE